LVKTDTCIYGEGTAFCKRKFNVHYKMREGGWVKGGKRSLTKIDKDLEGILDSSDWKVRSRGETGVASEKDEYSGGTLRSFRSGSPECGDGGG